MGEIERIKQSQKGCLNDANEFAERFIYQNPAYQYMTYPLFWIAYDYFSKGRVPADSEEKCAEEGRILYWRRGERCFFVWGSISPLLTEALEKRFEAKAVFISLNRRGFNMYRRGKLDISVRKRCTTPSFAIPAGYPEPLASAAAEFLKRRLGSVESFMESFNDAAERLSPIFMITDEDRTKYKKAAVLSCRGMNIRTITIQHGMTPSTSSSGIPYANESFAPLYSDSFIAWGESAFSFMSQNGVEPERVKVCGRPDYVCSCRSGKKRRALLVIDQQFLSFEEEREIYYRGVKDIISGIEGGAAIYMRGNYNREYLKEIGLDKYCIEWRPGGIEREICSSSAVLSYASTALVEAAESGVKAVSFDYMERGDVFGFKGRIETCSSAEEAVKAVKSTSSSAGEGIEFLIKARGKEAAENAADAAEETAG